MNSLAYLSRQFDVLASSPPRGKYPRKRDSSEPPLQRDGMWSARSFLFSQSSVTKPRRRLRPSPSFPVLKSGPSLSSTSPSSFPDPGTHRIRPGLRVRNLLRRFFLIRVFVFLWERLRATWLSLWGRELLEQAALSGAGLKGISGGVDEDKVELYRPRAQEMTSLPQHMPPLDEYQPPSSSAIPRLHNASNLLHSEPNAGTSRSPTPLLGTRKTPFHLPKTLVLDLDETLIHSTTRAINNAGGRTGFFGLASFGGRNKGASHIVEVVLGGKSTLYHVYKRPFVDFFLRTVSRWYTLVIFTASMQEYADPVIDWLDAGRGILSQRLFRDSCTQLPNGSYTKDLALVEADLSRVCLIDNSPISYRVNEANGIPIEGWTNDPHDEALLDLLPVLDSLRFTSDVRRVLGLRIAGAVSAS